MKNRKDYGENIEDHYWDVFQVECLKYFKMLFCAKRNYYKSEIGKYKQAEVLDLSDVNIMINMCIFS